MYKLLISPDAAAYTVKDGKSVVTTQLEGGAGRYRQDIIGATSIVTVSWTTDVAGYTYLRAFYNTGTSKGALPFLADLIIDQGGELTEHLCHFIPESMTLSEQRGLTYVVTANLEIEPVPADELEDQSILLFYGSGIETDVEAAAYFNALEQLTNYDLAV